ncbi:unnamed protein product [Timema podura]|uniref:Uncharacterized protein n=1 Tax=Timema podura TaxID=61482 RepID=A0ABN7P5E0_TIMPD|nr:unnamed protein product [Timema podura]
MFFCFQTSVVPIMLVILFYEASGRPGYQTVSSDNETNFCQLNPSNCRNNDLDSKNCNNDLDSKNCNNDLDSMNCNNDLDSKNCNNDLDSKNCKNDLDIIFGPVYRASDILDNLATKEEIDTLCQRCAKSTKSSLVYPMCCQNKEEVMDWCKRYISFGIQ